MSAGERTSTRDAAAPTSHAHYLRSVLAQRGFRRLLSVRVLAQIGDGMFQAGLAGSVLFNPDQGADAMAVAAGFAVLLLPYSLIGPYLGVLLDRWSRRSIIYIANMIRAILVIPTALLIWRGDESIVLFGLALLIIGLGRFFLAGLSAATPHLVDDHALVTANAVAATFGSITYSIGLGGAAVLVKTALSASFHGYGWVAVLGALFYAASAVLGRASFGPNALGPAACQRPAATLLAAVRAVAGGTVAGVRHLAEKRGAAYAVLVQGMHRALYGVLLLDTLLLYRTVFNTGDDVTGSFTGIGKAFAAGGVGLLFAAFATPPVARRIGGWRWVTGLLAVTAVAIGGFGLPMDPALLLVAVFVINVTSQGIKIVVDTSLQHECADVFRGRVFSINDTSFNLMLVVGMYVGALVLPANGVSVATLLAVCGGYAAVAVGYATVAGRWARSVGDDIAQPDGAQASLLTRLSSER